MAWLVAGLFVLGVVPLVVAYRRRSGPSWHLARRVWWLPGSIMLAACAFGVVLHRLVPELAVCDRGTSEPIEPSWSWWPLGTTCRYPTMDGQTVHPGWTITLCLAMSIVLLVAGGALLRRRS